MPRRWPVIVVIDRAFELLLPAELVITPVNNRLKKRGKWTAKNFFAVFTKHFPQIDPINSYSFVLKWYFKSEKLIICEATMIIYLNRYKFIYVKHVKQRTAIGHNSSLN